MKPLLNMSLRRGVLLLMIASSTVIGGTSAVVKIATEHLLYRDATSTAQNWARLLAESVSDLEQIAG
ncbi:MAG TPA: hypothetical protein VLJ17_06500, partial [Xanthobacteraceae bacterium]|nr:hypothetical protein [Xanthobacteraceae bacterium]